MNMVEVFKDGDIYESDKPAPEDEVRVDALVMANSELIAVMHCEMVWESASEVISLHATKKGAIAAMKELKQKRWADEFYHGGFEWFGYKKFQVGP